MDPTWTTRELPALRALVDYFDDPEAHPLSWHRAADAAGMDHDTFKRALTKLAAADPPVVNGTNVEQEPFPVSLTGVTERALVAAGQWPSPESRRTAGRNDPTSR